MTSHVRLCEEVAHELHRSQWDTATARMQHKWTDEVDQVLRIVFAKVGSKPFESPPGPGSEVVPRVVHPTVVQRLTARQVDVCRLLVSGRTPGNEDIAKELFIDTGTVKTHLRRIFRTLKVSSRIELALVTVCGIEEKP